MIDSCVLGASLLRLKEMYCFFFLKGYNVSEFAMMMGTAMMVGDSSITEQHMNISSSYIKL